MNKIVLSAYCLLQEVVAHEPAIEKRSVAAQVSEGDIICHSREGGNSCSTHEPGAQKPDQVRFTPFAALAIALLLTLAACGGPPASPTAIPADVARPQQPTPVFADATPVPAAATLTPDTSGGDVADDAADSATPAPRLDLITGLLATPRPPTALGIATGGATLLDAPGGAAVQSLPAGTTVTVTGRSADGNYLAAYTEAAVAGWVAAGNLRLFGADDLTVVERAEGPGPIATLIAEAMEPVEVGELELDVDLDAEVEALLTASP